MNFKKTLNDIVFSNRRNFDCYFYLSSLFLSDFKSDFLKVLKPFITSDRKHIFIKVVEFLIIASCNDSQHERIWPIVFDYFILKTNRDIELLNWSREESRLAEHDVGSVYFYEIFCLCKLSSRIIIFSRLLFFRTFNRWRRISNC